MKYYKSRRKSHVIPRILIFRILFVILAAALVFTVTILIGNHLKSLVESTETPDDIETQVNAELSTEERLDETAVYDSYSPTVFGSSIRIADYIPTESDDDTEEKSVVAAVEEIAAYYDTLSINVTDENGNLFYSSPALCSLSRIPCEEDDVYRPVLEEALKTAKAKELRTCAVFRPVFDETSLPTVTVLDSTLFIELRDMGFDEILLDITALLQHGIDYELASLIRDYLTDCSASSGDVCKLGVIIPADIFLNASVAKHLHVVLNASSFIAIQFDFEEKYYTDVVYDEISSAVSSLLGNFSIYNMRVLIDSRFDLISAAAYKACTSHGVKSVIFSRFILPEDLVYIDGSDSDDTSAKEKIPDGAKNPYATTSENPSIGANDRKDTENSTGDSASAADGDVEPTVSPSPWY